MLKNTFMQSSNTSSHEEGKVTKKIEDLTAKVPSDMYLWDALAIMAVSLAFQISGKKHTSLFIGQWAAPFLLFGIYNKLVKQRGHDVGED
jgi:hypothetical protein